MIGANNLDQREWWISSGLWYPPMATRMLAADLDLLYRETGLVRVRKIGNLLSIWWDVDNADRESLDSVVSFLDSVSDDCTEVALSFFKVGWMEERHGDLASAQARIEEIDRFRGIELLPETRIRRLGLTDIAASTPLLRRAFGDYSGSNGYERLISGPMAAYGLFFDRICATETLIFCHVGQDSECARMLGEAWRKQAVGTPSDGAFADEHFDQRISASYLTCLDAREPVLEHIVGLIDVGPHAIWLPYQRLLLPDGDRLACFTSVTKDVVTPLLTGQSH